MRGLQETRCIAIAGYKNTGKTTLVQGLTRWFAQRGRTVAVMKRDVHGFAAFADERVDTGRHLRAGAKRTLVVGRDGHLGLEIGQAGREELGALIGWMGTADVLLLEGWKDASVSMAVLLGETDWREEAYTAPAFARAARERGDLLAWIAPRPPLTVGDGLPVYLRDDIDGIAAQIERAFRQGAGRFDPEGLASYALGEQ